MKSEAFSSPDSPLAITNGTFEDYLKGNSLLDLLPIGVCVCDAAGIIRKYNRHAVKLWGIEPTPDEHREHFAVPLKLYNPDGRQLALHETPVALSVADGLSRENVELIIERPDLTRIMLTMDITPLTDKSGKITGVLACFQDSTKAKHSEQALMESENNFRVLTDSLERRIAESIIDLKIKNEQLKQSEERYHKMIEEIDDYAILLLDRSGIIQNWNKGAERIKGYKEEEIVGNHFRVFYLPDDQARQLPFLQNAGYS